MMANDSSREKILGSRFGKFVQQAVGQIAEQVVSQVAERSPHVLRELRTMGAPSSLASARGSKRKVRG